MKQLTPEKSNVPRPTRQPRRPNAKLSPLNPIGKLAPEQKALVEEWLFDQNYSYAEVGRRCEDQFGVHVGKGGLTKYYRMIQQRRAMDAAATSSGDGTDDDTQSPEVLYDRLLHMVGKMAVNLAKKKDTSPDHATIRDYIKLLSGSRREMLQNRRFSFEREKWEYDVSEICLTKLPELKEISHKPVIPFTEKIRLIRLRLFGCAPQRITPLPEPAPVSPPALMPPAPAGSIAENQPEPPPQ